jgi:host factor-I protein
VVPLKDTIGPTSPERPAEQDSFANRRLIRPAFNRAEHNHNHAASPVGERRDRSERTERPERGDRPDRADRGDRMDRGKRSSPPEQTNAENFYYQKQMQARTSMVIVLRDGEQIHGVIEWYDRSCIKVNRNGGANLLIYKPAIKYMFKEGENIRK